MKVNKRKQIKVFLIALISILTISIGYASISAINMLINGNGTASVNQNNFKVHFTEAKEITGTTGVDGTSIIESDDTVASFNVMGLSKTGDYAEAKYTVKNDSAGIGASIGLQVTNSNSEYFIITETIDDNKLQAGEETLATVKVEMIKTPTTDSVTTNITATLTASPLENANAIGGDTDSKVEPTAFARDSWATIKTNVQNGNTNQYNIGDTKEVTINNTNYTVRLSNKTTGEHCGDEDTAYSQTACGFVVEFLDVIGDGSMNSLNTNIGGYPGSELYTNLQGTVYNSLPSDLRSVIKPTRVISGYGSNGVDSANFVSTDKLYLLSGTEIYGTDAGGNNLFDRAAGTTHQLEYYSSNMVSYDTSEMSGTNLDIILKRNSQASYSSWMLRSAYSFNGINFTIVGADGRWNTNLASITSGISPAFRIG